ncbi:serine hydrolase domain-containing protein [Agromyces albus]|uniref:serine hydrolase domain-containing protein n=1 Tax=Agromyces albus TaxID=205332 RepID=UPI0027864A1C|nr:serine hydrolase domain-containing protein [Agromyces albus]MDQ0577220.1 CubicO group peptidase (beta-lactamase class C family) [Agromyces albus]
MIEGTVAPGYERVRSAFADGQASDPGGAQLCVHVDGRVVVDLVSTPADTKGFDRNSLTMVWSTTKGAIAICAAMLMEAGELDVDAPVTKYWPEFGAYNKREATTAHLLAHTVGLPVFPSAAGITAEDLADRDKCLNALVGAEPMWQPGTTRGFYHAFTFGYLVGEVIRRITGQTEGEFFAENVARPLGLDLWIGLPEEQEPRVWPRSQWGTPPALGISETWATSGVDPTAPVIKELLLGLAAQDNFLPFLNTREGRAAEISSANGVGTAKAVSRMYAALVGEVDGHRLLNSNTLDAARVSRVAQLPPFRPLASVDQGFDRGLGFWLSDPSGPYLLPGGFGHPGAGGVHGFGVPDKRLAVGYTCTSMNISDQDPRKTWVQALAQCVEDRR